MPKRSRNIFALIEKTFILVALFFFLGAVIPVMLNPDDSITSPLVTEPIALVVEVVLYSILLFFIAVYRGRVVRALAANYFYSALLVLCLMSTAWSEAPDVTLRRSILVVGTAMFGVYLGSRFTIPEIHRFFCYVLFAALALSVLFIVALPTYGNEGHANLGAWRGVFLQKNIFARYVVLSIFTFFCLKPRTHLEKVFKITGLVLAGALLAGSLSLGSYITTFVFLVLIPVFALFRIPVRRLLPVAVPAAAIVVCVLAWASMNLHLLVTMLGKSGTLSGRVPLWHILMTFVRQKPLLGYGVEGFWTVHANDVWAVLRYANWTPLHAHNGFIDFCLQLGFVGSAILVIQAVLVLWTASRVIFAQQTLESQWPLMALSLMLFYNLFETDFLHENGFFWLAFGLFTVALQRYAVAERSEVHEMSAVGRGALSKAVSCPS